MRIASKRIYAFILALFQDVPEAHDPYAWLAALQNVPNLPQWFPSASLLQSDFLDLVKAIGALKAQETLTATLASSFNNYMNPGNESSPPENSAKSPPNATDPLIGLATSFLTNMMAGNSGAGTTRSTKQANTAEQEGGGHDALDNNPLLSMASSFLSQMAAPSSNHSRHPSHSSAPTATQQDNFSRSQKEPPRASFSTHFHDPNSLGSSGGLSQDEGN
jgi:hypothetical protein